MDEVQVERDTAFVFKVNAIYTRGNHVPFSFVLSNPWKPDF